MILPLTLKKSVIWLLGTFLLSSCQPEVEIETDNSEKTFTSINYVHRTSNNSEKVLKKNNKDREVAVFNENVGDQIFKRAVIPSECGATKFSEIQLNYYHELESDPLASSNYNFYSNLNFNAAYLGIGEQYFGEDGEYTNLVKRIKRDLEKFWDMPDEIMLHGQHNETLNDREMLVEILWYVIADVESKEDLYPIVDDLLEQNARSPVLPESPFFSSDGLSTFNDLIIIGDGLIKMFALTGVEEEVVWSGILAHEWSHQIQIDNIFSWYPFGSFDSAAEQTRQIELEADFFSAYYLTHKRGAAYNWKKVDEFLELFFQAGDCSFEFELHHGTPQQRMMAAEEGYQLAASTQKKGQILTPEEVHEYFIDVALPNIIY